ncbi:MAG: ImmA/IrrE family metallo-endopeptidase [Marinicaulis sp.]|nr:ImmA/IrrE family metallo-endopeptidase [Marinicaulis sp.]
MRPAEQLLTELGISEPRDIDIDAIAYCVGAEIDYRSLTGCEAQIIGRADRAVIYVRKDIRPTRKRFSAGHELGHWHHHRGLSFVCRPEDIGRPIDETSKNAERVADAYAADLVLPRFMIAPKLQAMDRFTLNQLIELAGSFSASVTATAIRAVRLTRNPVILIAHNFFGRRWQWPSITAHGLRVRDDIDARSSAFGQLAAPGKLAPPRKEPASYWFERRHIERFDVDAQSMTTVEGESLTLIRILDQELIDIYAH